MVGAAPFDPTATTRNRFSSEIVEWETNKTALVFVHKATYLSVSLGQAYWHSN